MTESYSFIPCIPIRYNPRRHSIIWRRRLIIMANDINYWIMQLTTQLKCIHPIAAFKLWTYIHHHCTVKFSHPCFVLTLNWLPIWNDFNVTPKVTLPKSSASPVYGSGVPCRLHKNPGIHKLSYQPSCHQSVQVEGKTPTLKQVVTPYPSVWM